MDRALRSLSSGWWLGSSECSYSSQKGRVVRTRCMCPLGARMIRRINRGWQQNQARSLENDVQQPHAKYLRARKTERAPTSEAIRENCTGDDEMTLFAGVTAMSRRNQAVRGDDDRCMYVFMNVLRRTRRRMQFAYYHTNILRYLWNSIGLSLNGGRQLFVPQSHNC